MKKYMLAALVLMSFSLIAFAQVSDPIVPPSGPALTFGNIEALLRRIGNFLLSIAVVVAVIVLAWGGITYMIAGSDETRAAAARTRIWNAIIGIAIIFAIGLILRTIAAILTQAFFGV